MKSVLISINPKWCELIASGEKTVEVRKTKPKLETPFKVYIYCTMPKNKHDNLVLTQFGYDVGSEGAYCNYVGNSNGKVIGEFVCDAIFPISCYYSDPTARFVHREQPFTCLTDKEMIDYLGNGVEGYGWHISNLVIYDKPKELSEFHTLKKCTSCKGGYESSACIYDEDCKVPVPITRPPQSWCYVEGSES